MFGRATITLGTGPHFQFCLFLPGLISAVGDTFSGALPPDGILPGAKFTLRPSLAFSYIVSVTVQHSSSGVSQTLWHGTRNGITELSQRAPTIFGWGGPHVGHRPAFYTVSRKSFHLLTVCNFVKS